MNNITINENPSRTAGKVLFIIILQGIAIHAAAFFTFWADAEYLERNLGNARYALASVLIVTFMINAGAGLHLWRRRFDRAGAAFGHFRFFIYCLFAAMAAGVIYDFHPRVARAFIELALCQGAFLVAVFAGKKILVYIPRKLIRACDFAAFNICMILLIGELGLRVAGQFSDSPIFDRADLATARRVSIYGMPPGFDNLGFAANSMGFYDTEFIAKKPGDDHYLAIMIGDSFSQSIVPHPYHYTTVIEQILPNCKVYNVGVASAGPWDYLYWAESVALPLNPDLVIVSLFVGNDIFDSERRTDPSFADYWPSRGNLYLWQVTDKLIKLKKEDGKMPRAGLPEGVAEDKITKARGELVRPAFELERMYPWLRDPLKEKASFSEATFLEIESTRIRGVCYYNEGFELMFKALSRIQQKLGKTRFAVMIIPDEFQVEDELWEKCVAQLQQKELQQQKLQQDKQPERHLAQKLLGDWLTKQNIPYLDLLPALRAAPPLEDGKRHLYHLRDSHFNARGNRFAGNALAEFIKKIRGG
ncbi:MAG: hypothetical protein ACKVS6_13800 [Planctomycetota bacterium]